MKILSRVILLCPIILGLFGLQKAKAQGSEKLVYPKARKADVTDKYFSTKVADPYRWMENDTAPEVKQWVRDENKVTQDYLSKIPYRSAVRRRLTDIWDYERYSNPFRKGEKYFYYKNNGLQNQSVLYVLDSLNADPKVLLDPNKLSTDGTVSLGTVEFSRNGRMMGYTISRSGSDWQEIYVLDVMVGRRTRDSIRWAKFSGISWERDGFYYSRFNAPGSGSELSSKNENQKIYFHKLGTKQAEDVLIFEDKERPLMGYGAQTTKDERMLFVYGTSGASSGNELYYKPLNKGDDVVFTKLFSGTEYSYSVVDNMANYILVLTNKNAPHFKLVLVDPLHPEEKNWKVIIPEGKNILQSVALAGGKLFATYMQDAAHHVYQYELGGRMEHEINLPGPGTVSGFEGDKDDKEVFYTYTSFIYPPTVFKYNIASGRSDVYKKANVNFNPDDYISEQVFTTSKDGTKFPIFIVHKKGIKMDGNNPCYLYGYGGFNISLNPNFSITRMILLENGGIYAQATLRGGGEYGEEWHKAGMLGKKQNVFDDFISAAEYLINNKYTSSKKLAIAGRSNGGLLVGACMTQRPELYAVAFPGVGVMDMLRYHRFTIGYAWATEYGCADSTEREFKWLYAYSPIHNLKKGVHYPATMVNTADHDDRVVPAHSFKFAATLQEKHGGDQPVLISIDSKAGHGAGKPTAKQIEEWTDAWCFFFYNTGVTPSYK